MLLLLFSNKELHSKCIINLKDGRTIESDSCEENGIHLYYYKYGSRIGITKNRIIDYSQTYDSNTEIISNSSSNSSDKKDKSTNTKVKSNKFNNKDPRRNAFKECEKLEDEIEHAQCMIKYNEGLIDLENESIRAYSIHLSEIDSLLSQGKIDDNEWQRRRNNQEYLIEKCKKDIKTHQYQIRVIKANSGI